MPCKEYKKYTSKKLIQLEVMTLDDKDNLFIAIQSGGKILIYGEGGSGKTILTNCLIEEALDSDTKLYVAQECEELYFEDENREMVNLSAADAFVALKNSIYAKEKCAFVFDAASGPGRNHLANVLKPDMIEILKGVHDIPILFITQKVQEDVIKCFDMLVNMKNFKIDNTYIQITK